MSANGLRPYPSYRDSGLDWLGEVPEHWELRRGKTFFRCIDERSETGSEELLTVSSDRGIVPRDSTSVTMFKAQSYVGHKLCWPGDLVINSLWAWSRGLGVSRYHGIVSTAYGVYRVRRKARALPDFIHSLVRSEAFNWELRVRSKGIWISRLQLTDDSFLRAPLPLPPLSEQRAIARYLEAADRRIRRYIRAKERLIELLEERKRALIHEAVTGRIDVRTGQPHPAYKDSGVEWLGEVPEHWEVLPLCGVSAIKSIRGKQHRELLSVYLNQGVIRFSDVEEKRTNPTSEDLCQYQAVDPGDFVLNNQQAWRGSVGVSMLSGIVSPAYLVLALNRRLHTRFANYLFRSQVMVTQYRVSSRGVGSIQRNLYWPSLERVALPVPPITEQVAVFRFLDHADRRIRAAISATQRQIELVHEYRTRLIADVVTGKLDVREAAATLPETGPLAGDCDRADAIPTESNLHATAQDMMKEASA